ncbi:LacI family DNA-binding transcriptional regulator [Fodinibius sediminis]|uniref:Transcriptional regulator, LacI family n=1 Tax=Fodinibius sediminis TaxID=1214077 RepID=A0A521ECX3_9BACT|nr:LacI family DNA-binding transcriptional regulator [Fodinibius sediminis]SMO81767.1 transcriptional regulator, LacI family [Fodinibius sediminis]
MKNVRLKDIAERLDLTKVSVSKALRDHSDISDETKRRVKKMAEEMGYRPNLVARSLTSNKTQIVGVIVPKIAHSFFSSVIEGIYQAALKSDYEVILGVSMEDDKLERKHIESMLDMRVEGLLISVSEKTKSVDQFDLVKRMDANLVFFDRGFSGSSYTYLKVNDREGAKRGVRHMIERGYEKIGHLSGFMSIEIGKDRRLGYQDALEEAGRKVNQAGIVEAGFSEEDGYRGFAQLMEQYGKPDAVFCVTYPVGLGVLQYMKDHEIDPSEIAILSFGSSEFNQYLANPFTCIDQSTFELGYRAFEQLVSEIESDEEVVPQLISLEADILDN